MCKHLNYQTGQRDRRRPERLVRDDYSTRLEWQGGEIMRQNARRCADCGVMLQDWHTESQSNNGGDLQPTTWSDPRPWHS